MKENTFPKNRIDVFLDVFKMNWSTLVYISLILGAFALPTVLVIIFSQLTGINILTNINTSNSEEILEPAETGSKSSGKNDVVNKFEPIDDDNLPF